MFLLHSDGLANKFSYGEFDKNLLAKLLSDSPLATWRVVSAIPACNVSLHKNGRQYRYNFVNIAEKIGKIGVFWKNRNKYVNLESIGHHRSVVGMSQRTQVV